MKFLIVFILLLFKSCSSNNEESKLTVTDNNMNKNEITLPGKFVVVDIQKDSGIIYDNSNVGKIGFKVGRFESTYFSGRRWMNTTDYFVASENINSKNRGVIKANLVKLNINNNFIDHIYKANEGELAEDGYLTKDDRLLLFTITKRGDVEENPFEGLMRMNSLFIMDFKSREIIKKIDSVGIYPIFSLEESPWLYDGSGFIYNINYDNGIAGSDELIEKRTAAGIYIYNIVEDKRKLLIPEAYFGICSPAELKIAYKKDQSIYCFNLKDNSTKLVYKAGKKERVRNMHWTPDGKYIYLAFFNYHFSDILFDSGEKLIEVETGKEIPFKRINHGFQSYSWK